MSNPIVVVTGDIGSGKTTLCRRLIEHAGQLGIDCTGILSPGRFSGTVKVGIDLLDLRSGERRRLAEADEQPAALRTQKYRFDAGAMAWGRRCLDAACPCDLLMVDELGPLELERGEGWVNALDILRTGSFRLAVVVVRPRLLETFRTLLGDAVMRVVALPPSPSDNDPLDSILTQMTSV